MRTEKSLQKIRDYVTALEEQYFDLMDLTASMKCIKWR